MLPKVVSHYEILETLGHGGMGVVYHARDTRLDRPVALKFLSDRVEPRPSDVDRFMQEARAASSLDHPNICTIYDIGKSSDDQLFIVMALYEGETVRQLLERGPLSHKQAVDIAIQVLTGLARAHARHIVHRDIKPANLMLTTEGLVKILDFGLAKLIGQATIGDGGALIGTLSYMSPEQINGTLDHRTDIWSTGVVLYEMLTGRLPFEGESASTVIHAILDREPLNMRSHRPDIPFELDRVMSRALAKDPALRYRSANDMLADLRQSSSSHQSQTIEMNRAFVAPQALPARQVKPSVAVLPFNNISRDPEAEYFSDGLSEELIHALSQLKGLHVVSRTSAFQFKGQSQDVRVIADRLGVNTILEGSVRKSANKLRVTVLLTNAADGYNIWSQRYDREIEDVFTVQDEIATSVANLLFSRINPEHRVEVGRKSEANAEAWNLYLKGRFYWHKATEDAYRKAQDYFKQAIEADPACAPAYSGLADFYRSLAFWGFADPREAWPVARQYATKALELDPTLPQPHITMGRYSQQMEWNRQAAAQNFRRAIELNPSHSDAHAALSIFLLQAGRFDEALEGLRLARSLDPLNLAMGTAVAWLHYYRGEYDRAFVECRKVLDLEPNYFESLCCMGMILEQQGKLPEAETWWERGWSASGKNPLVSGFVGRYYALTGRESKSREILAGLEALAATRYTSPIAFAFVYLGLRNRELALKYVEKAFNEHDSFLSYAAVFPPFQPLLGEPDFVRLLNKMDLR